MKRLFPAILLALGLASAAAQAQTSPRMGCSLDSDLTAASDQLTITCIGVNPAFAAQLSGVLTYILQNRLDPGLVVAKLGEIEGVPEGDAPRTLDDAQGQAIVKSLVGKPTGQIAIVAHPQAADAADYARAIATKLLMVGWQIEGSQIRRAALPRFDEVVGLVLVVRDDKAPPEQARLLRAALASARILAPIVSDGSLPAEATVLWVGKRPQFNAAK